MPSHQQKQSPAVDSTIDKKKTKPSAADDGPKASSSTGGRFLVPRDHHERLLQQATHALRRRQFIYEREVAAAGKLVRVIGNVAVLVLSTRMQCSCERKDGRRNTLSSYNIFVFLCRVQCTSLFRPLKTF